MFTLLLRRLNYPPLCPSCALCSSVTACGASQAAQSCAIEQLNAFGCRSLSALLPNCSPRDAQNS
eukprot:6213678-Pleurochrysis_carterae.AAC.11